LARHVATLVARLTGLSDTFSILPDKPGWPSCLPDGWHGPLSGKLRPRSQCCWTDVKCTTRVTLLCELGNVQKKKRQPKIKITVGQIFGSIVGKFGMGAFPNKRSSTNKEIGDLSSGL